VVFGKRLFSGYRRLGAKRQAAKIFPRENFYCNVKRFSKITIIFAARRKASHRGIKTMALPTAQSETGQGSHLRGNDAN
jgi:hypothetical protein